MLAPSSDNLFCISEILTSFPGITLDENITVSSLLIDTSLCVPWAILFNAPLGSPWEPVQIIKILSL